jgi:hypothetical protein
MVLTLVRLDVSSDGSGLRSLRQSSEIWGRCLGNSDSLVKQSNVIGSTLSYNKLIRTLEHLCKL